MHQIVSTKLGAPKLYAPNGGNSYAMALAIISQLKPFKANGIKILKNQQLKKKIYIGKKNGTTMARWQLAI